jgi:nitrite reductase/ring-hydroxylating ferredoxin subunit
MIEPTVGRYTEGDAFQAEKRILFSSAWLPMCHVAQVPTPGDFVSNGIGGWPVFAVHGDDGVVRVFRNVCRHQQMQVVEKPSGTCTQLRCRYHGWTYDRAGKFVTAPDPVAPADRCSPANHLPALRTVEQHGFVLFTLGEGGARPGLTGVDAIVAQTFGDHAPVHTSAVTAEIGCNWKTYLEYRLGDAAHEQDNALGWPLLVMRRAGSGIIAEQIVPRTFLRTRVVFHALGDIGGALAPESAAVKAAVEALQGERAAGNMPVRSGRVAMLWDRLAEALACDTAA